jgi:hypothetical protein
MSYTTKVHLRRRFEAIDFRFLAAILALGAALFLTIRYF